MRGAFFIGLGFVNFAALLYLAKAVRIAVFAAGRIEPEDVHGVLAGVEAGFADADGAGVVVLLADFVPEAAAGQVGVEAFVGFDCAEGLFVAHASPPSFEMSGSSSGAP